MKIKLFLQRARLYIQIVRKIFEILYNFLMSSYPIYTGHKKIIDYDKNGYPLMSYTQPGVVSKPALSMYSHFVIKGLQGRKSPVFMGLAVTDKCNANCQHCLFYSTREDPNKKELTLEEIKKFIIQAQDLGGTVFNFVGGEPLMREDFPEILKSIDKDRSISVLFTNGWFLEERAEELKQADLDVVFVSIDSARPEEHNKRRGTEGLYERAMKGIEKAKKVGLKVGICCSVTEEDVNTGELDKIIELAKEKKCKEVIVFDNIPAGKLKDRNDLVDNHNWIEKMIEVAKKYNDNLDYPGVFVYHYVMGWRGVGCISGTLYFYVTPYGDICPCDFNPKSYGNLRDEPLWKIYERMSSSDDLCKSQWGICRMKDSAFRKKLAEGCKGCGNVDC